MNNMQRLILLNSAIVTTFGTFEFSPIELVDARRIVAEADEVVSAIGHESTAAIMTELLEFQVPMNRVPVRQEAGENALVFRLKGRPPEGVVMTREEIDAIGYEFALLRRLK